MQTEPPISEKGDNRIAKELKEYPLREMFF
jgi:hypothetical protein